MQKPTIRRLLKLLFTFCSVGTVLLIMMPLGCGDEPENAVADSGKLEPLNDASVDDDNGDVDDFDADTDDASTDPQLQPVAHYVEPQPGFHPRVPYEWQGMIIDVSMQALCDTTRKDSCGMAMACHDEKCIEMVPFCDANGKCGPVQKCLDDQCGPCENDNECAENEACVLDHCVVDENVECQSRLDCEEWELCTLSGITGGEPRGNSDMHATCLPCWDNPDMYHFGCSE